MTRKRRDYNQGEIAAALRKAGASVAILADIGRGIPDLLVGYRGRNFLIEIKNLSGRGNRFTPAEVEFKETWRGQLAEATDVTGALGIIGGGENEKD